jgi:hypothetical protein
MNEQFEEYIHRIGEKLGAIWQEHEHSKEQVLFHMLFSILEDAMYDLRSEDVINAIYKEAYSIAKHDFLYNKNLKFKD